MEFIVIKCYISHQNDLFIIMVNLLRPFLVEIPQ